MRRRLVKSEPNRITYFVLAHFKNQIQGLFKAFQGPYKEYIRRSESKFKPKLLYSIYKQVQFTFDNLTHSNINQKLKLSEKNYQIYHSDSGNTVSENHLFGYGVLRFKKSNSSSFKLSRTFRHRFKDFR